MARLSTKEVSDLARRIIAESPGGVRYTDLHSRVSAQHPETPASTIQATVWNLHVRFPKEILKPSRGLFVPVKAGEPYAEPPEQMAPAETSDNRESHIEEGVVLQRRGEEAPESAPGGHDEGKPVQALRGLLEVPTEAFPEIPLSESHTWLRSAIGRLVKGGVYLLGGQPGIGKSTLGLQLALDLASHDVSSLYLLTEQSKEDLARRARLMTGVWPSAQRDRALRQVHPEEGLYAIDSLPRFLMHQVISPGGKYNGVQLIIVDSVQGHGVSATATRTYKHVYEFCRQCKAAGITVLLVSHVTKRGEIAGPKDLEHNVDCILVMRKAMAYRPLFVPKNRFGPAVLRPILLEMDRATTVLSPAHHSQSLSTVARSFLGGAPLYPKCRLRLPYLRTGRADALLRQDFRRRRLNRSLIA
jgi:KaiC/GvpD/RAD55 family RecA-like ATPase